MNSFRFIQQFKIALPLTTALLFLTTLTAFSQKPELYVQTGHSSWIYALTFSPDGKLIVTGALDTTIKIWDRTSGRELRTLRGHSSAIGSVAFSPDGRQIASGSVDQSIKLWDVATGKELKSLVGHSGAVHSVAFSPDGKQLASGSADKTIKLWDLSSGQVLRSYSGHSDAVRSVAFSPDGKRLSSGSEDKTIRLWDVQSGRELKVIKGYLDKVVSVSFSPDGKTLAGSSFDDSIRLWNATNGKELKTLIDSELPVYSISFSPDGKTLASGSLDGNVRIWDVASGRILKVLPEHSRHVFSVCFSPDGRTLASGGYDQILRLWDVVAERERQAFSFHSSQTMSVAVSPDGKRFASSGSDREVRIWDAVSGLGVRNLVGHTNLVDTVAFSPNGKILASAGGDLASEGGDKTIRLWDVSSGQELKALSGDSELVETVAFSPDGKVLASGGVDSIIKLWDVSSGHEIKTLKGHVQDVRSLVFSPDGKVIASGGYDQTIRLWDVASGVEIRTLRGHSNVVGTVAFSPDGRTLASGSYDKTVKMWDVSSGKDLGTLKGHTNYVSSVTFSPDGKTLASSGDNVIRLWKISSMSEVRTLTGHSGIVSSVAFTPDGQTLVSGSFDSTCRVWDVNSGSNLASLIAIQKDWVVVTPDGLFDGSPVAWNNILWRFSPGLYDVVPVEAYFGDFYYPGLLSDVFARKNPKAHSDISQKDRRQPQVKISVTDGNSDMANARNIGVKIQVQEIAANAEQTRGSGVRDVRLFRNGSLVKVWHGDVLPTGKNEALLETTLPIIAGENTLTAYAFNRDNIKSSDAILTVAGADSLQRQGKMYILAVGVNKYANPQYNLTYANADAQAFATELQKQQTKLNRFSSVEVISLLDVNATKANILAALGILAGQKIDALPATLKPLLVKLQQSQPEDAIVVYFAGHGTAQQNRFYLIPHDLGYTGSRTSLDNTGLQAILSNSISDIELEAAFEQIDAGNLLFVIDACNSGQALEAEEKRRGPMNSKGLAQLAYEKGMYILTASQSYQAAQEASQLGHGFLTYSLVEEGLKTRKADSPPFDGQVDEREWLDYATARVPQLQQELLSRPQSKPAVVPKPTPSPRKQRQLEQASPAKPSQSAPVQADMQRPRVFYRRETEKVPLVIARP